MLNGELASVPTNDLWAELDRRHEAVATKLFFKVGMAGLLNDPEERGELETGGDDE